MPGSYCTNRISRTPFHSIPYLWIPTNSNPFAKIPEKKYMRSFGIDSVSSSTAFCLIRWCEWASGSMMISWDSHAFLLLDKIPPTWLCAVVLLLTPCLLSPFPHRHTVLFGWLGCEIRGCIACLPYDETRSCTTGTVFSVCTLHIYFVWNQHRRWMNLVERALICPSAYARSWLFVCQSDLSEWKARMNWYSLSDYCSADKEDEEWQICVERYSRWLPFPPQYVH